MKEKLELYIKNNYETFVGFRKARYVLEDSCLGRASLEDLDYESSVSIDDYSWDSKYLLTFFFLLAEI